MKVNYKLLTLIAFSLALLFLFYQKQSNHNISQSVAGTHTNAQLFTVVQSIDFDGVQPTATFSAQVQAGETVLSLLQKTTQVEVKESSFGKFVESINGVKSGTDSRYWLYYINGQPAQVGAADFKLEEGQKVEWRLEKSQ